MNLTDEEFKQLVIDISSAVRDEITSESRIKDNSGPTVHKRVLEVVERCCHGSTWTGRFQMAMRRIAIGTRVSKATQG